MSTRAATRLLLGCLAALALGLSIRVQLKGRESASLSRVPAVDNPGPLGLEAAYLYLAERHQAARLEAPPTQLPADIKVIVTALPYSQEAGPEERQALWAWVERGGTLVVLGDHGSSLGGLVPAELSPEGMPLTVMGRPVGLSDLGSDIETLLSTAMKPEEVVDIPAYPALPDPLLAGVSKLGVSADRGLRPSAGSVVPLATAGDTPVLDVVSRGRGEAYFLAGPDMLTNARLDRADNLRLLANLAERGTVYFDEYHHHAGASASAVALARALAVPFAQLLLLGAMLAWAFGRRLGPLQPTATEAPRTSRDYASQVGQLYRAAHAEAALTQDLARDLCRWLERRLGVAPGLSQPALASLLARRDPALARRVTPLLERLEARGAPPSPEAFAELCAAVVTLQQGR